MPTVGKDKLAASLDDPVAPKIILNSFQVGEDIGFTPNLSMGAPEPLAIYTGGADKMAAWYVSPYFLAIRIFLPHAVGPFDVGNIMIFDDTGTPIVGGIARTVYKKYITISDMRAGNHLVLTLGLRSASQRDLSSSILLDNVGDALATISSVETELLLKPAPSSRIGIANIDAHTNDGKPVAAYKIPSATGPDIWMGMALYDIAEVASNTVSGGTMGDGYA
jgi:hypothetical protein